MNPALLGSVCSLSWGTADFAARFSGRALGHDNALLGTLLISALALTAWVGLAGPPLVWVASELWLIALAGVGITVATLFLYEGLALGPVSIVAPIAGSYPAAVTFLAVALGARPSLTQWLATAGVMAGVVVGSRSTGHFEETGVASRAQLRRAVTVGVIASASFAVGITAGQLAVPAYGEIETLWLSRLVSLAALLPVFLLPGHRVNLRPPWWPLLTLQGVLDSGAYLALFAAGGAPGGEVAVVIGSTFGAVTVLLARVVLREAITWSQWLGIGIIFVSVAALYADSGAAMG